MLTNAELAQMQADILSLLPDTCNILGVTTRTSDGMGGLTETWGTVTGGTAVACRMDFTQPGREAMTNDTLTPYQRGMLSLPYSTVITTAHRVEFGSETYNVIATNTGGSKLAVRRVVVERVP
jgi:head-tail adaptor